MPNSKTLDTQPPKTLNIFGQPLTIFGVPVDRETIFSNHKGAYKKRVEKRQRKLIVRTTFIKFFLERDERIFCLTTGYSPISILEQALTGLAFLYFKRSILVFTEKRLLHIPLRPGAPSSRSISQILYEDCASLRLKGRALVVQLKNGRQESFPYIARREKKKINALLTTIPLQPNETGGGLKGRVYLCPSCTHVLTESKPICQRCQLKFKSKLRAQIGAALIPGGGYFYCRYPLAGIFIACLEVMLIIFLALKWIDWTHGLLTGYGLLALLTGGLILEKIIVTYHAQKLVQDFLPAKKDFTMQKMAPASKNP
jgi:hypothetical protein